MKTAIIHDWLTGMRGGEKVLEAFCELFPDADLYVLLHIKGSVSPLIEERDIKTSFIQKLPFVEKRYRYYLPLFPMAIEEFDLRGYDLILSSSHCVAKGIIPPPDACHAAYIHTPMRYVWDIYHDYFGKERVGCLTHAIFSLFSHYLRTWDAASSLRVDYFICNSTHVAKRVKKYYRRDAEVIHPPVDTAQFMMSERIENYYLIVSALAPYKRVDLAIETFNQLKSPLKIIGTGQEENRLRKMARGNIEFLGWQSLESLKEYYAKCRALVFPGEEDFGITPVEAMASGRPVIAYGRGGILDTVTPFPAQRGETYPTGVFFRSQTVEDLSRAIREFEDHEEHFISAKIRAHALQWDRSLFKERIKRFLFQKVEEFKGKTC